MKREDRFAFGQNWKAFSAFALTAERVASARHDFHRLLDGVALRDRSFLDIGFGQGLALCLARESGAETYGNDIDPSCLDALTATLRFFPNLDPKSIPVTVGSILDDETLGKLRKCTGGTGHPGFDIVHSWGVLHHTGRMDAALNRAASLVRPGGHFIIAIYNRHWSSPLWWQVKRLYVASPRAIRSVLIGLLYPVIALAKLLVTGKNPFKKERGMSFYYDVIDWVGGFPYEYATISEVIAKVSSLGFKVERSIPSATPTGCNEFVFRRG